MVIVYGDTEKAVCPLLDISWGLQALRRRTLDSERPRYAIAWWPDKLGTDPMMVNGKNQWTPSRNTITFSLSVENEQADAGQDGRACLTRPNSRARTETGKYSLPCSADREQDYWLFCPVDP